MKLIRASFYLLFVGMVIISCNNDTLVGSNILDSENLDVEYVEDTHILASTIEGDSVLTFLRNSTSQQTYMLGILEDDLFGRSEAEIYLNAGLIGNIPNFEDPSHVLDSIVLVLKLDTLGHYGNPDSRFNIDVFRLTENINEVDSIYSDRDFEHELQSIGGLSDFEIYYDSISIMEDSAEVLVVPQLRITLDPAFGEELMNNEEALTSNEDFFEFLNGFYINASTSNNDAIMGIDLSTLAYQTGESELALYYHNDTIINQKHRFFVGSVSGNRFKHDYSGSDAGAAIADPSLGQELLYAQSMAGVNMAFDLSDVLQYNDRLLNHAELEFMMANLPSFDKETHPPIQVFIGSELNDDGALSVIDDISQVSPLTGYTPEAVEVFEDNGVEYYRYKVIVTHFINDIMKQRTNSNILTLTAFSKPERPNRSVIYGPEHSLFPAKLKMTLTKP